MVLAPPFFHRIQRARDFIATDDVLSYAEITFLQYVLVLLIFFSLNGHVYVIILFLQCFVTLKQSL